MSLRSGQVCLDLQNRNAETGEIYVYVDFCVSVAVLSSCGFALFAKSLCDPLHLCYRHDNLGFINYLRVYECKF